jgi:chromosomal replication initiation ATPase DnaA
MPDEEVVMAQTVSLPTLQDKWDAIRKHVQADVGQEIFDNWLIQLKPHAVYGSTAVLSTATVFLQKKAEAEYAQRILLPCIKKEVPGISAVSVVVRHPVARPREEPPRAKVLVPPLPQPQKITIQKIQIRVAQRYNISLAMLKGGGPTSARQRKVAMYICMRAGFSLRDIGHEFNKRRSDAVNQAIKQLYTRMQFDVVLRDKIEALAQIILSDEKWQAFLSNT